ncbi:hypothetical protein V0M98_33085 (plasmid) [Pseudomonas silesiensis]|uniref:hypothetical protein n=1 Tax=Pseudomonas silesiensis TaxID=1853130 RepID=UPI0030CB2BBD
MLQHPWEVHQQRRCGIQERYGADAVVEVREDTTSDLAQYIKQREGRYPSSTYVIVGAVETTLCACPCHREGMMVMH